MIQPMASPSNDSTATVSEFLLICFPNFQSWQHWLSLPLSLLFLQPMGANTTLLITIQLEALLYQPLYYLLSLLSLLDIVLCFTIIPKALAIFWFDLRLISFPACFFQMFIMNSFLPMESCMFMVMAICHPHLCVFIVVKNALLTAPIPILTSLLHYCGKNVIENCICANLLSCDNFTLNRIYQFVAGWTLLGLDFILIFLSYTFILRAVLRFKAGGVAVKALSTCGSHFILILFFSTILLVLVLINVARKKVPMDILILLNVLHHLIPPALNPIVYGVRTKEIKQGIQKLLQRGR
uniref:G-protein coupled receptors family 1 profile domain-containing protein n=1 Tax=Colobus angolensis palliatus TaxID=336983 RepID=A0A2K5J481_COLAP